MVLKGQVSRCLEELREASIDVVLVETERLLLRRLLLRLVRPIRLLFRVDQIDDLLLRTLLLVRLCVFR